jgi:hypothetical protein
MFSDSHCRLLALLARGTGRPIPGSLPTSINQGTVRSIVRSRVARREGGGSTRVLMGLLTAFGSGASTPTRRANRGIAGTVSSCRVLDGHRVEAFLADPCGAFILLTMRRAINGYLRRFPGPVKGGRFSLRCVHAAAALPVNRWGPRPRRCRGPAPSRWSRRRGSCFAVAEGGSTESLHHFDGAPFVHWSSQARTVSCHRTLLAGFRTQWFSSGK